MHELVPLVTLRRCEGLKGFTVKTGLQASVGILMLTAFSPFAPIIVSLLFDFHLFLPPATVVARRQCLPSANEVARVGMCAWQRGMGGLCGRGDMHGRGHVWHGDMHGRGCAWWGGACVAGWDIHAGWTATEADSTHPIGMHSCSTDFPACTPTFKEQLMANPV